MSVNTLQSLEARVVAAERKAEQAHARGAVENVFSRYMHLHNVCLDDQIIALWVKEGTEGIQAQYSNVGVYTTYESVTAYHRGRPKPVGKLLYHQTTTPIIEVAEDCETAQGQWLMSGLESGLIHPDEKGPMPDSLLEPGKMVQGKHVWSHWVWCQYKVDFLKQDGVWKIWKFRCMEVARAPYYEDWISFADKNQIAFDEDLMYFGANGKAVFMPTPNEPAQKKGQIYGPTFVRKLEEPLPQPYKTFADVADL